MRIRSFTSRLKRFWKKTSRNVTYAAEWQQKGNIKVKYKNKHTPAGIMFCRAGVCFMLIFAEFGDLRGKDPGSAEVQQQVKKLQSFITQHYYKCSNEILAELGKMYVSDPKFTESIDNYGGDGTAEFTAETIKIYCKK